MVYNTTFTGLDINVYPIPVKTDVGQVDLVLRWKKSEIPKRAGTTDKSGKYHLFQPV